VIEDEVRLAENIAAALREGAGFAVDCAADGETGWALTRTPASQSVSGPSSCYDLIVLDLMLPELDGLAVLKRVRAARDRTPVLILTARSERRSVIELLNAGADDYLTKPFDLGELIARAKALIRRGKGGADPMLRLNDIELNTLEQTVRREDRYIELSPMEYRILEYLMHRPRVIVSKRELLEHLYDYNWEHHSNVIEAHVSNLRRKLDADAEQSSIETLRGRGYRLSLAAPQVGTRAAL
jgi:two-component system response regulator PhoP